MDCKIMSAKYSEARYASYALMLRDGTLDVMERRVELGRRLNPGVARIRSSAGSSKTAVAPVSSAVTVVGAHHYLMAGRQITYSATSRDLLDLVDGLWYPFGSPGRDTHGFEIVASRHESGYTLQTAHFTDSHLGCELQLKGRIQRTIVETIYAENEWLAVLHAGAVSRGGEALALLGATRVGKSTLIAGLTRSGFDYLSDDCVPVSYTDQLACSVPTALSLRQGSWTVLADRIPELAAIELSQRRQERIKHWFPSEQSPAFRRQPLRWLIHPRFAPLQSASVRKLEPLEALQSFVASGSSPGRDVDSTHLQRFAGWLEGLEHHAISYRSLDEAVSQIKSIVGA